MINHNLLSLLMNSIVICRFYFFHYNGLCEYAQSIFKPSEEMCMLVLMYSGVTYSNKLFI